LLTNIYIYEKSYKYIFIAKKDGDRFDRAQWKNMQPTMNDTTKFVDMMHNVPWEDGLPDEVVRG